MENQLENLQRRVAELEAALARISNKKHQRIHWAPLIFAGVFALLTGIPILMKSGSRAAAEPPPITPTKMVQPLEITDAKGRVLIKLAMTPSGGGTLVLYNESGNEQVVLGSAKGSGKPRIAVLGDDGRVKTGIGISKGGGEIQLSNADGNAVVALGVGDSGGGEVDVTGNSGVIAAKIGATKDGAGLMDINWGGNSRVELGISNSGNGGSITLKSGSSKASTIMLGDYGIRQNNAEGQPIAQFGTDDSASGYFMVANRTGKFMSRVSVATDGSSGRVEVMGSDEVKVLMGVKENGKGDVCANGDPGKQICMSLLALKSLIAY